MYEGATSSIQINGHQYGPIPVRCADRQGCPMSMALYTLGLHPLLKVLEQKLPGLRMGNHTRQTSVIAYADDVTIFVTSIADFRIIEEDIRLSKRASGARLNPRKSKAIAVVGWCTRETVLGIDYHTHATILCKTFWGTIAQTIKDSWARQTTKVRLQAKQAYTRDQCIAHRIRYVHGFLYTAIHPTAIYCHHMVHLEGSRI